MPCYAPLAAYRSKDRKSGLEWSRRHAQPDSDLRIPCGMCIGCRIDKVQDWAIRINHEAKLNQSSTFATLTYDDEHLPPNGTLRPEDMTNFLKRLRHAVRPNKIRYYQVGEYGGTTKRPHHHVILFGWHFPDRVEWSKTRDGLPVFKSAQLSELWPHGLSDLGTVTPRSAAYVARYVTKKIIGNNETADAMRDHRYARLDPDTGEVIHVVPEYATMSRRPGLGYEWFRRFGSETLRGGSVIVEGKEKPIPEYYLRLAEQHLPAELEEYQFLQSSRHNWRDNTPARLRVRETVANARLTLKRKDTL